MCIFGKINIAHDYVSDRCKYKNEETYTYNLYGKL